MGKAVNVERMNIRFRNVPQHVIRPALPNLGSRILRIFAGQESLNRVSGSHSIDQLNLGTVRLMRGATSTAIENAIVRALSRAIIAEVGDESSDF